MKPGDIPCEATGEDIDRIGFKAFHPKGTPLRHGEEDWERASRDVAAGPTIHDGDDIFSVTITFRHNAAPRVRLTGPVPRWANRDLACVASDISAAFRSFDKATSRVLRNALRSDDERTEIVQTKVDEAWARRDAYKAQQRAERETFNAERPHVCLWCQDAGHADSRWKTGRGLTGHAKRCSFDPHTWGHLDMLPFSWRGMVPMGQQHRDRLPPADRDDLIAKAFAAAEVVLGRYPERDRRLMREDA